VTKEELKEMKRDWDEAFSGLLTFGQMEEKLRSDGRDTIQKLLAHIEESKTKSGSVDNLWQRDTSTTALKT
jgi:FtsZ-binding cell division protein ZapB